MGKILLPTIPQSSENSKTGNPLTNGLLMLRYPYDGCSYTWAEAGHPRASSSFPHAICYYVKEKKILTLEEMIHKMTGLPAQRLNVENKGLLKDGYDADMAFTGIYSGKGIRQGGRYAD